MSLDTAVIAFVLMLSAKLWVQADLRCLSDLNNSLPNLVNELHVSSISDSCMKLILDDGILWPNAASLLQAHHCSNYSQPIRCREAHEWLLIVTVNF